MKPNIITKVLNCSYPIIQGGMVWVSGAKLAAACSNAGAFGLIGAGSMKVDLLASHIKKAQSLTQKSFGVNIPLLYKDARAQMDICLDLGVKYFFTSAGSPVESTRYLKDNGATVFHVISNPKLAIKCQDAGVDGVVAEGFEAGGHNGRDELTSMVLIPMVADKLQIPVIAAGGIVDGRSVAAALALGASGVQMGTRFVACLESSAHNNFVQAIIKSEFNATKLMMKSNIPVRLLHNDFADQVSKIEKTIAIDQAQGAAIIKLLGHGRARAGMLNGDIQEGELEIGQACALIKDYPSAKEVIDSIVTEYNKISFDNW